MDAYIYAADLYCAGCGAAIRAELDAAGKRPADVGAESSFDSDEYPKGPYADGGGESDTPENCARCGRALENPLTTDGVQYVIDALEEAQARTAVLDAWAADVADYRLTAKQDRILDLYRSF